MVACASFQERNSTLHQDLAADKTQEAISLLSARICEAKVFLQMAGKKRSDSQKELEAIREGNERLRASCEGMDKPPIYGAKGLLIMFNAAAFAHLSMHIVCCWDVLGLIICAWIPYAAVDWASEAWQISFSFAALHAYCEAEEVKATNLHAKHQRLDMEQRKALEEAEKQLCACTLTEEALMDLKAE